MTVIYPAVFHREDGAYWVEFPDLEGCQSWGDTLEETLSNAKEALCAYCLTLIEQRKRLTPASNIQNIPHDENSFVSLVDTKLVDRIKSVKKTLTIPAWLNTKAEEAHAPYSQILQRGLEEYLGING